MAQREAHYVYIYMQSIKIRTSLVYHTVYTIVPKLGSHKLHYNLIVAERRNGCCGTSKLESCFCRMEGW